jgi:uncharacterized protein (TIGR00251 family)
MAGFYDWRDDDLLLTVKIQPRSSRNEIVGELDGALKIRITATPVDGKANKHLIDFLAEIFQVPKSQIEMLSGKTHRDKRFLVHAPRKLPTMISR